jgi:phage anti-repressor protein/uncharacterized protein YjgD (DUF1641 family)
MVRELTTQFNTDEQKWFIANLYMYLNYHQIEDYPINLENIWKFIGFASKANSKKTLKNNFILGQDYKITEDGRDNGRFTTETVMLNIDTFKNLCMIAKTEAGKKIRKYHIKLESIYNKLTQEDYIVYQEQLKAQILQIKEESIVEMKKQKHNVLVDLLKYKKCIYFQEVKSPMKDVTLIKIGSSKSIEIRNKSLKKTFGTDGLFLEVFECNSLFRDIERNILNDPLFKKNKYNVPLENGHVSNEIVMVSVDFSYEQLVSLVKRHISDTTEHDLTPLQVLESKRIDLEFKKYDLIDKALDLKMSSFEIINVLNSPIAEPEEIIQEVPIETPVSKVKNLVKKTKNFGRKIQKIDPDNLHVIIETYKDMETLLNTEHDCSETGIRTAIVENRIYKNYRWIFVNDNEQSQIQPTVVSKKSGCMVVFEVNETRTEILNHFKSLGDFAKHLKISKCKARNIIDKKTKYNECYYIYYNDCKYSLIQKYPNEIPIHTPAGSIKVKSIHPLTKEETIFPSLKHAHDAYKIHHKTVHRAIEGKRIANGHYWEYVL